MSTPIIENDVNHIAPDQQQTKQTVVKRHPLDELLDVSSKIGYQLEDVEFARHMDSVDPLRHLRDEFCYPKMKTLGSVDLSLVDAEEDCVYFCGNSLGLMPRKTRQYMEVEIDKWERTALEGHTNGDLPWAWCDECLQDDMGKVVGAKEGECAIMNGLTVNLHLLLISFYNPTPSRYKILIEGHAFPSDHYAMESQIRLRGYDPATALILLEPREGEHTLRLEDILAIIEKEGDSIATICLSGVQYYTGQKFDIPTITKAGQKKGCMVGWDLAHAVGNIELSLHDWEVDFACWCTYKYLNCGAGCLSGLFVHQKHFNKSYPQLQGWWGHVLKTRFEMDNNLLRLVGTNYNQLKHPDFFPWSPEFTKDFEPYTGALSYRLSNTPGFLCPPIKASLEILKKTSISDLVKKCHLLTGYLEARILRKYGYKTSGDRNQSNSHDSVDQSDTGVHVEILTPSDPDQRGAQLSLSFSINITHVFEELMKRGVVCDERKPKVIRVAPAPMYCSFEDVHRFMKNLDEALHAAKNGAVVESHMQTV